MTQLGFNAMQDQMDSQKAENAVLRQKLRSKADALLILTQQLDKVRIVCTLLVSVLVQLQTRQKGLQNNCFSMLSML